MTTFVPDRFYRPGEIWKLSGAPRSLIYASLASGQLRSIRRGRWYLVPGGAVLAWIEEARDDRP